MAIKANLLIDQGTDYATTIKLADDNDQPINLEGYTGRAQIRKYYTSLTSFDFDVDIEKGEFKVSGENVTDKDSLIKFVSESQDYHGFLAGSGSIGGGGG
jgi:hypothetical protein